MQLPRAFTLFTLMSAAAVDPALAAPLVLAAGPSPAEACAKEVAATDTASPRLKRLCDEAVTQAGLTDHDRAASLANAGTVRLRLGELDAAIDRFEEARELAPELEDISISQSAALIRLGRYEEVIDMLHQPGRISEERRAYALYNRAMAHLALDAPGPAHTDLEEALRLKPDYAAASVLLDEIVRAFGETPGA
jgi:tetratricopeptide (TPR) repeat protein